MLLQISLISFVFYIPFIETPLDVQLTPLEYTKCGILQTCNPTHIKVFAIDWSIPPLVSITLNLLASGEEHGPRMG